MEPSVGGKRLSSRVNYEHNGHGDQDLFAGEFERELHDKYDLANNGIETENPNRNDPTEESKQLAADLDNLEHTMDSELASKLH